MIMKRNSSFSTKSIWAGMKYMQTVLPAGPEREIRSYIPVKQDYSTHHEPGRIFLYSSILVMPSVAIFSDFPFNSAF